MTNSDYIQKTLPSAVLSACEKYGQEIVVINATNLKGVARILKDELGFDMLLDISALDWSKWVEKKSNRFEIDYFFYSTKNNTRLQLKVPVPDDVNPVVDSITEVYSIADWSERECWDMMGVKFEGHPNLKRLLMWRDFVGHPLRKDYPVTKRQPLPIMEDLL